MLITPFADFDLFDELGSIFFLLFPAFTAWMMIKSFNFVRRWGNLKEAKLSYSLALDELACDPGPENRRAAQECGLKLMRIVEAMKERGYSPLPTITTRMIENDLEAAEPHG